MDPQPLPADGGAALENLRINRWHAGLQAATANMLGPFIALLALRLGATNLQLGALSALPNLLTFLFTLPIVAGLAHRRRHGPALGRAFLASRLTLLAVVAVPFFHPPWEVWALVLVWGLHNFPFNAANSVIQGYLADLLPEESVAGALAQRGVVATVAGTATVLALGAVLDRLPFPAGYQGVALAACLIGLAEVYAFRRFVEAERVVTAAGQHWWQGLRQGLRAVRSRRRFVSFLLTAMFFNFTWQLVWPIFNRFQVEALGANNLWFAAINVAGALGGVFTFRAWSRRAERTSPARAMVLATGLLALAPLLTRYSPTIQWVVFFQVLIGAAVAGVTQLLLQGSLYYAPAVERSLYLGVFQTGLMAAASLAPLLGGWLMDLVGTGGALVAGAAIRVVSVLLWWWMGRGDTPLSGAGGGGKIRQVR